MKLMEFRKIFNPELEGKAVRVSGRDRNKDVWKGVHLVQKVHLDKMDLMNIEGRTYSVYEEDFVGRTGQLKITMLVEGDEVE